MAAAVLSNGDYIPPSTKRVSYILPQVRHAPRLFQLPSLEDNASKARGRSGPLLLSSGFDTTAATSYTSQMRSVREGAGKSNAHPRHVLPVSSLALDTSTVVGGDHHQEGRPTGILYTGGRDGMIGAWELGLNMKKRQVSNRYHMPGEELESTTGLLDEQAWPDDKLGHGHQAEWEVDIDSEDTSSPPAAQFRQCIGSHTDWINDIVLCNRNQTVISASSDRSVKIWNPHDPRSSLTPQTLGTHSDYVRALAYAPEANWIASGAFDQTIKVWDIQEMRPTPIMTIGETLLKNSVYGLSINANGSVVAAASPEKTIQLFDLRSGQQISQLIGHTDNVRSVVLSKDGSHLLSASSDSTIRLWSLSEQRCMHTFTHHNDSVWSLFSNHDSLDVFYSGDRSGVVCKVDWERCNEVSEGECVVLAKEKGKEGEAKFNRGSIQDAKAAGIYRIVAADNAFFWTANSNAEVSRWRDVPSRSQREAIYPIGGSGRFASQDNHNKQPARPTSPPAPTARSSALRPTGSSSAVPTSVSFAEKKADVFSSPPAHHDGPASPRGRWRDGSAHKAATLYGLPFDSLICLAPPDDLYGAAIGLGSISMRTTDRKETGTSNQVNTMFSSASLISIPSVLRATSSNQRDSSSAHSPTYDGATAISPSTHLLNAHLMNAQNRHFDGAARPSSTRSASIRFAPVSSHSYHGNEEEGSSFPGNEAHFPRRLQEDVDVDDEEEEEEEEEGGDDDEGPEGNEATLEARQAFEERESAMDATPLRKAPEDVIHSSHGLIRSCMLNDRRHVLTIDSAGHIFLWDIVSAQCLGAFDWFSVVETWSQMNGLSATQAKAAHLAPGEALDIVKERIQGEGTTPMWCTVDTKIGALSVHFDFPRCFDAEIYVDEVEDALRSGARHHDSKEDQRLNVAKLVLRNLFDGFLRRESSLRSGGEGARIGKLVLAMERPGLLQEKPDLRLDLRRRESGKGNGLEAIHSPGMTIALAIPAKTPAILPISSPLTPRSGLKLPGLQQMLGSDRTNAAAPTSSEDSNAGPGDYFSIEKSAAGGQPQTPQAKTSSAPAINSPGSPGGSGLMGRLRMSMKRGDQKREDKGPTTPRPLGLALNGGGGGEESQGYAGASTETKQHLESIRRVMAKADPAKVLLEFPLLHYPAETAIMISDLVPDTSSEMQVDYRGLVKSTESDVATLEVMSPTWLLEFLVGASDNAPSVKEKDKLTFLLVPWEASPTTTAAVAGDKATPPQRATMTAMPTGNSRLTATKMLRIKKACSYVADKLNILDDGNTEAKSRANSIIASRRGSAVTSDSPSSNAPHSPNHLSSLTSTSSSITTASTHPQQRPSDGATEGDSNNIRAHEMIEIMCNGNPVPPFCTLSQVQRFYWKNSNVIRLEYRWKES